ALTTGVAGRFRGRDRGLFRLTPRLAHLVDNLCSRLPGLLGTAAQFLGILLCFFALLFVLSSSSTDHRLFFACQLFMSYCFCCVCHISISNSIYSYERCWLPAVLVSFRYSLL